ncbi:MAG: DUF3592 domain-containing protein [Ruminococcus sp.]|nr:DUF3592 domain-containing protein [Ruminococcus sp.]
MIIIRIISAVFFLSGIILFITTKYLTAKNTSYKKRCIIKTEARVSGNGHKPMEEKDLFPNDKIWYPFLEFYVSNKPVNHRYYFGTDKIRFNIDEQVEILYNPDNSEEFYIPADKLPNRQNKLLIIYGAVCFIIGILLLFLTF